MMTTDERFDAAASVIRNLPKNGAYQPSDELMLKFYGYYKQATAGPCTSARPAFWQHVKKARWEAWARLGNMSQRDAMNCYIDELKRIIETMSYNEDVANFMDRLDTFCENIPLQETSINNDTCSEQARSVIAGSSSADAKVETFTYGDEESVENSFLSSYETCHESFGNVNSYVPESEVDDEFIDSLDYTSNSLLRESSKNRVYKDRFDSKNFKIKTDVDFEAANDDIYFLQCNNVPRNVKSALNCDVNDNTEYNSEHLNLEFMNQIMVTLKELQSNLDKVVNRIGNIEEKMHSAKKIQIKTNFDKSCNKS